MEGALSLALPINKGQTLSITQTDTQTINWTANRPDGLWFSAKFSLPEFEIVSTDNSKLADRLKAILITANSLSHGTISDNNGCDVETNLDFNPEYGFGTSSTLISNIASWVNIDPYELLWSTFGGSGYDIACARSNGSIFYQRLDNEIVISEASFNPLFKDNLYFVYLGSKQSSKGEIDKFRANCNFSSMDIDSVSEITKEIIDAKDLFEFEELISEHESIMSKILKMPTVGSLHFSEYSGVVKSLGAWGGDFILMTNNESKAKLKSYLNRKGFNTIYEYSELELLHSLDLPG